MLFLLFGYYLTDHLGSTRAVVDEAGTVLETHDYYPFGLLMPGRSGGTNTTLEKFTGKERDSEGGLNLDYFGARYYDPAISRWLSVDPLASKYPSLSPYNYVANNPIRLFDPNGRDIVDGIVNQNFRKAYREVLKTEWGRSFIGLFANKGDTFFGHTFSKTGAFADQTLTLSENPRMTNAEGRTIHKFDFGGRRQITEREIANDVADPQKYINAIGGKLDLEVSLNPSLIGGAESAIILGTIVHEFSLHASEEKASALVDALNSGDVNNIVKTVKQHFDSGGKNAHQNFKNMGDLYQLFLDRLDDLVGNEKAQEVAEDQRSRY